MSDPILITLWITCTCIVWQMLFYQDIHRSDHMATTLCLVAFVAPLALFVLTASAIGQWFREKKAGRND